MFVRPIRVYTWAAISLVAALLFSALPAIPASAQAQKPLAPQSPSTCSISFPDVHTSDYFYESVRYLYCLGAATGYSDGTYRPYSATTRGQISKMIVIARGWPINTAGGPHFSDVQPGSAFYNYVETAYLHGVIAGYSDGTFHPGGTVTRGQVAKIVVLAQGWPLLNPSSPTFSDVARGSAYYTYVETATDREVISGYADGTFRTGGVATRGQIAKFLYWSVAELSLTAQEQQTIDLVNQRRAAMGLGALHINPALMSASRRHSDDIGPAGLCQHNGTDGTSPWDRIAQAGYSGAAMGEVLGCGYTTAQGVVDAWWASPAHYAILTDSGANDIGCGWWIDPTNGAGLQTCDTGHYNR